jgi:hypothetical protein
MWYKTHDMLVKAIAIGGVAVLLVFAAAIPIYQNATTVQTKLKAKTKELEALTSKVSILSKLDANVLQARVDTLDKALPPRKDVLLYLTSIDGLSRELGLTLGGLTLEPGDVSQTEEVDPKVSKKVSGLQSLTTDIKIRGTQDNIYTFLRTLETVLPLMQIKDIKVSVATGGDFALSVTLGMLWAEPTTVDIKGPVTLFGSEEDNYFSQLASYRTFEPVLLPAGNNEIKTNLFAPTAITPQQ